MRTELFAGAVAVALVSLLLPVVSAILRRGGVFDHPSDRSSHLTPTPRGAGAAQLVGVSASWGAVGWVPSIGLLPTLAFSLLGLLDDLRAQKPFTRLTAQVVIGVVASFVLVNVSTLSLGTASIVIAVSGLFIFSVNAANFMDGINGISALHGIVLGLTYWWLLTHTNSEWAPMAAALVGASLAFMPWNWGRRARLFLGDSGSYLLGALLATFAIVALAGGLVAPVALAPLVIYGTDVIATMIRRAITRQSLLSPHREHIYQKITRVGWSHSAASLFVAGFSTACCLVAIGCVVGIISPFLCTVALVCVAGSYVTAGRLIVRSASR